MLNNVFKTGHQKKGIYNNNWCYIIFYYITLGCLWLKVRGLIHWITTGKSISEQLSVAIATISCLKQL